MRLHAAILAVACSTVCLAQTVKVTPVYIAGAGTERPVLLHRSDPEYSNEARLARLQGTVTIHGTVGEDGRTHDLSVVHPLGLGLDEKAAAAVAEWHFLPALRDGHAIAIECQFDVNFRLGGDVRNLSLSRIAFSALAGDRQPMPVQVQYRDIPGLSANASFHVSLDVDQSGVPVNVQVDSSSDPEYEDEVIALIREWRFQAAIHQGIAVVMHGSFDLTRGLPMPATAPTPRERVLINGEPAAEMPLQVGEKQVAVPRKRQ